MREHRFVIIADLRVPEGFDSLGMLKGRHQSPAIDPEFSVGHRQRCQPHPHVLKLGDESFRVKFGHF
jgi:hypothetical protein